MFKVSIIVPSYKRNKDLVARAIDSLLNQTYKNIEIVLVDDNAKQEHEEFRTGLEQLVETYNDERIIYIKNKENLGGSLARNNGIANSSGDYITFLDDDDRYLPEKIEKQLRFMLDNDLEMSFTDLKIFNEQDKLIDYREHSKLKSFDKDTLLRYHITKQITGTNTFMYKKEALLRIGCFVPAIMGQEYYLMLKTIENNLKIGYLATSEIVAYRYDIEAISTGPNKIKGERLLFNHKKEYFDILSFREKQYVICRHYAVMAVAYKRNGFLFKGIGNLILSVLFSPWDAIKEAIMLIKKIKTKKGL